MIWMCSTRSSIRAPSRTIQQTTGCEKMKDNEDDFTFIYSYVPPNVDDFNETITIGFLGAYGQAQVVLGALPLAVMDVNKDKGKNQINMCYHI